MRCRSVGCGMACRIMQSATRWTEHSITPELEKRAGDEAHTKLVREACRQSLAHFVRKWLMREDYWRADRFASITVIFPDEAQLMTDEQLEQFSYEPTIKL